MRALVAFDKYKDALSARQACAAAAETLVRLDGDWEVDLCPLTDGGDGFAEILTAAVGGARREVVASGPRGTPVRAAFGLVRLAAVPSGARARLALPPQLPADGTLAVVEMAAASGLALLAQPERDPWQTTTRGTGELIRAAYSAGCAAVLLGVGGSATNDLGCGALEELGLRFEGATGECVTPLPAHWSRIVRITGHTLGGRPIRIACDVSNPLLGPNGCTAVFGPQKGLLPTELDRCERAAARLAGMLCDHAGVPPALCDRPGMGAAGGIAFGLAVASGAQLVGGSALVADWLELDRRIAAADIVLTGEGRFDASSLQGKGPGALLARCHVLRRPIHVFAGSVAASVAGPARLHAITPAGVPLPQALAETSVRLQAAIERVFAAPQPS